MGTPIKRHESLQPFSREHHHALLLSWKIREGLKHGIELERIKNYAHWFWQNHLQKHFEDEEKYLFTVLPTDDELVKQALNEHQELKALFESNDVSTTILLQLEKTLDEHIRFEERILFNKIQEAATPQQLDAMAEVHAENFNDNWEDEFWVRKK